MFVFLVCGNKSWKLNTWFFIYCVPEIITEMLEHLSDDDLAYIAESNDYNIGITIISHLI